MKDPLNSERPDCATCDKPMDQMLVMVQKKPRTAVYFIPQCADCNRENKANIITIDRRMTALGRDILAYLQR